MIPQCVNDLCLDKVFEDYSSSVSDYLQVSDRDEHIVDSNDAHISGFVSDKFGRREEIEQKYFEVHNLSGNEYALLQIDNGIIQDRLTQKCDCAIANDSELCLIEFKANAYSNKISEINQNYSKAINQLSATLRIFKNGLSLVGKNMYELRNVEAFICFRKGYPRKRSSQMNFQISFAEDNNGIPLSFCGYKNL